MPSLRPSLDFRGDPSLTIDIGTADPFCSSLVSLVQLGGEVFQAGAHQQCDDPCLGAELAANGGATITALCIGTFVLAESGLLTRQRATTTWWLAPLFRKRYSDVLLDESDMIVKSGRFVTAGAALSHVDLALWLVRSVMK